MNRSFRLVFTSLFLLLSNANTLAEGDPTSRLSLDISIDEQGSSNSTFDLNYAASPDLHLLLTASFSDNEFFGSNLFRIGLTTGSQEKTQFGINYENWDSEDDFVIDEVSLLLRLNGEYWGFSISPLYRTIKVAAVNRQQQKLMLSSDASGIDLGLSYLSDSGFFTTLGYRQYHYSKALSRLNLTAHPRLARFVSPIALSEAQGLNKHDYSLDFGYQFSRLYVGLLAAHSQSAVDDSDTNTAMLYSYIPLTNTWELSSSAGLQDSQEETTAFASLGLTHYW